MHIYFNRSDTYINPVKTINNNFDFININPKYLTNTDISLKSMLLSSFTNIMLFMLKSIARDLTEYIVCFVQYLCHKCCNGISICCNCLCICCQNNQNGISIDWLCCQLNIPYSQHSPRGSHNYNKKKGGSSVTFNPNCNINSIANQSNKNQNTNQNKNGNFVRYYSTMIYRRPYLEWQNITYQEQNTLLHNK